MSMLPESTAHPSVRTGLAEVAESITQASDRGEIQALLHRATVVLGAERSFFASISGEDTDATYAFVLDCDPTWWHRFRAACPLEKNPWLVYAARHSTPVRATQPESSVGETQKAMDIALRAGFASAMLIPALSGRSASIHAST